MTAGEIYAAIAVLCAVITLARAFIPALRKDPPSRWFPSRDEERRRRLNRIVQIGDFRNGRTTLAHQAMPGSVMTSDEREAS